MPPPRCRPGDVAVIIKSGRVTPENQYKWVTVLDEYKGPKKLPNGEVAWYVRAHVGTLGFNLVKRVGNARMRKIIRVRVRPYPDSWLRPIRDYDGPDEVVQIFGKAPKIEPKKETTSTNGSESNHEGC